MLTVSDKKITLVTTVLAIFLFVLGYCIQGRTELTRKEIAAVEREIEDSRRGAEDAKRQLKIVRAKKAQIGQPPHQINKQEASDFPKEKRRPSELSGPFKRNPELAGEIVRADMRIRLIPFFRKAALNPGQRKQIEALLWTENAALFLLDMAYKSASENPPLAAKNTRLLVEELSDKIAALTGEDVAKSFADVLLNRPYYDVADSIAADTSYTAEPLSPEQAQAIVGALSRSLKATGELGQPGSLANVDWVKALASLRSSLSPIQIKAFEAVMQHNLFNLQFQEVVGGQPPLKLPQP